MKRRKPIVVYMENKTKNADQTNKKDKSVANKMNMENKAKMIFALVS